MTVSRLPLSYCTNVHPGRSLAEVLSGLETCTLPIRSQFGRPLAAGLWLARAVIRELRDDPPSLDRLRNWLAAHELPCYTLNAFPYGDFHSDRVKEQVYLPDWTSADRLDYTLDCAAVLAALLPADPQVEGSISTVPLGFKTLAQAPDFQSQCHRRLIAAAEGLARLRAETGRLIRLALEPEPCCVLETTAETIAFFRQLRSAAGAALPAVREHLGVCYDVCHQSVEFEDVAASLRSLAREEIRINKVHISCAIEVRDPARRPDALAALARYVEPRYLHQTFGRQSNGTVVRQLDLDERLATAPSPEFQACDVWRVHFHVPVDAAALGPLATTRPDLERALAVLPELAYAPHLEVETYTWEVLPGGGRPALVDGFARELTAARDILDRL